MLNCFTCREVFPGQIGLGYIGLNKMKHLFIAVFLRTFNMLIYSVILQENLVLKHFQKIIGLQTAPCITTTTTPYFKTESINILSEQCSVEHWLGKCCPRRIYLTCYFSHCCVFLPCKRGMQFHSMISTEWVLFE